MVVGLEALLRRVIHSFRAALCLPLLAPYALTNMRHLIDADSLRWLEIQGGTHANRTSGLLLLLPNRVFRSIFYHRIKCGNLRAQVLSRSLALVYRPCATLTIDTREIGPGLFVQHGVATFITARSIGANCWINQQVTIGYTNNDDAPILGNNVTVYCGAKVIGDIRIGDNVVVGANAVVVKDIPDNCVVAGVPARIIRRDGVRINESLHTLG